MSSPGSSSAGRKRTPGKQYSVEDEALNQIASEAERRLAARRVARAEAREIRLRELERQQKEDEEREKHGESSSSSDKTPVSSRYASSSSLRRGSNDSLLDEPSTRELKKELAELEEKYRKAMTNNAQLDTEKQTYRYQAEAIHDDLDDLKEALIEVQRLYKLRGKELDQKKREFTDSQEENDFLKYQLGQRDELIKQYGLVFINNDTVEDSQAAESAETEGKKKKKKKRKKEETEEKSTAALVTPEAATILQQHEGNLDDRLKKFSEEQQKLLEENKKLRTELEQEKEKSSLAEKHSSQNKTLNGPATAELEALEMQKSRRFRDEVDAAVSVEIQKQLNDYKFKLQKAEQDKTTLDGNVIRLESQVKRYRQAAENSEQQEEELKIEKRRLQRELREAQSQLEEVQTQNHHLQKRLERIKSSRNANI